MYQLASMCCCCFLPLRIFAEPVKKARVLNVTLASELQKGPSLL